MTAFNLFKKSKPAPKAKTPKNKPEVAPVENAPVATSVSGGAVAGSPFHALRHIHVSEKATRLTGMNKYTFQITRTANRQEIKKHVEQMFSVKVDRIHLLNMPSKTRTVGRYVGTKSSYRKAIVTLREGYTIGEAK